MNAQNFTQKTIEAVQTAQSMAQENRNSYITPEHLLYALVDQDGGLIPTLFKRMGVDCDAVLSELDGAIAALPKVGGDSSEVYMSSELSRVLSAAEKAAKSMGDEYLSVEHLMIGIFAAGTAANFNNNVPVVVGILGKQKNFQLLGNFFQGLPGFLQLQLHHFPKVLF